MTGNRNNSMKSSEVIQNGNGGGGAAYHPHSHPDGKAQSHLGM